MQAIEDAIADGLAKVPIVKKVRCSEYTTFEVIIVHTSPDDWTAIDLIVDRMIEIQDQLTSSGVAPDDIYLKRLIRRESDDHRYGHWGEKTLFERSG